MKTLRVILLCLLVMLGYGSLEGNIDLSNIFPDTIVEPDEADPDTPPDEEVDPGSAVVSGILIRIGECEFDFAWEYLVARDKAFDEVEKETPYEFVPPPWFLAEFGRLEQGATPQEFKAKLGPAAKRLCPAGRSNPICEAGYQLADRVLDGEDGDEAEPDHGSTCSNCRGTGKIGDGNGSSLKCPLCNGTGIVPDEGETGKEATGQLLVFTAEWCGPCKSWKQTELPELEKSFMSGVGKDVDIRLIDIDANRTWARAYGIQSVPTFVLVRDKKIIHRKSGGVSSEQLTDWLTE